MDFEEVWTPERILEAFGRGGLPHTPDPLVRVRFTRSLLPFSQGEVASFAEVFARVLVERGVAEFAEDNP